MTQKKEVRSISEAPVAGEGRRIEGYAIVWEVESRVLADWDGEFVEVIARDAVSDELLANCDVKALFNHNRDDLLARYVNGGGTLSLTRDDHGLKFAFDAPNTSAGNDVLELVRRGDLRGCSFAFTTDDAECSMREDGVRLRRVRKLSGLYDVSIVVEPAYVQTSVDARAFEPIEPQTEYLPAVERRRAILKKLFNPKK